MDISKNAFAPYPRAKEVLIPGTSVRLLRIARTLPIMEAGLWLLGPRLRPESYARYYKEKSVHFGVGAELEVAELHLAFTVTLGPWQVLYLRERVGARKGRQARARESLEEMWRAQEEVHAAHTCQEAACSCGCACKTLINCVENPGWGILERICSSCELRVMRGDRNHGYPCTCVCSCKALTEDAQTRCGRCEREESR